MALQIFGERLREYKQDVKLMTISNQKEKRNQTISLLMLQCPFGMIYKYGDVKWYPSVDEKKICCLTNRSQRK